LARRKKSDSGCALKLQPYKLLRRFVKGGQEKMVRLRKAYSSGRGRAYVDASVALDEEELMPEEVAVLKMIHSTNFN